MDRRHFLRLAAAVSAAPLLGAGPGVRAAGGLRVVVAGAGIVGASIAYHLAKAGAAVTVIDREGPATHASRGTFAWINATWAKQPRHYHRLNQESVTDWHQLQEELTLPVRWGGSLEWFSGPERQAQLRRQILEQQAWGEPARMLGAGEVAELEPLLEFAAAGDAAYSPNDGAVDPVLATLKLLEGARARGARIEYPSELRDVSLRDGRLRAVDTSTGSLAADRLVLATGAAPALPARIAGIDIPQRTTPGIIAVTEPVAPCLNGVVAAPGVHLHQRDDGRVIIGEQAGAPDTHGERLAARPNDFPARDIAMQHGVRMLAAARALLPALNEASIDEAYVGWRPLPLDGHPVLGSNPQRPDVYLAIMHSGVSLAPVVGQLATAELLHGETPDLLEPYRPTRRFERVRRY